MVMKIKNLHKLQGLSLAIAIGFLWYGIPSLDHKTSMIITSVIVGVNALIELNIIRVK